ncbi:MAG: cysteine desulfurase [Thelocarpon impressellum]|nr:MAG: cysteine desulfurase [Thelocarpon impressellum]
MSHIAVRATKQTSRIYSGKLLSLPSPSIRSLPHLRRAGPTYVTPPCSTTARQYVSESKKGNARVNVDTTIQADHKAFAAETGMLPENVSMPGIGMNADVMMSPAAGVLKQATIMDQGERPIYLDMQATTPTDPRVLDAMLPYFTGMYGNPHSRTHAYGWETDKAVEQAREHVANLIGADPKEIIFTSGATESNNMSIKGVARFFGRSGKKRHIITSQTEHKCVLDSCRHLQDEGFDVTYLPVQKNGLISMQELEAAIRPDTALVSIMTVNNEIGVIQPMEEIGKLCRSKKVFFHTDGAQALGKIPVDVNRWNVDLMSMSGHKIYGPNGIGACYVRRRPRVRLDPIISGGGQERGLRSGTLAPPLVIGFGEACRIAKEDLEYDHKRISALSERLRSGLLSLEHTTQNGDPEHFYPGCVNVSFAYIEGESLLMALKDIALSSGSACTSASLEPSYVLRALGSSDESAHSSIRFGIGRFTTESEIDYVLKAVKERVTFLRELSPLWELVQEGVALDSIEWSQH